MCIISVFFFFNDTATTGIYSLSLPDALPICPARRRRGRGGAAHRGGAGVRHVRGGRPRGADRAPPGRAGGGAARGGGRRRRSEEYTSGIQSRQNIACRLFLGKKKKRIPSTAY